jgi:hypothetical protein
MTSILVDPFVQIQNRISYQRQVATHSFMEFFKYCNLVGFRWSKHRYEKTSFELRFEIGAAFDSHSFRQTFCGFVENWAIEQVK